MCRGAAAPGEPLGGFAKGAVSVQLSRKLAHAARDAGRSRQALHAGRTAVLFHRLSPANALPLAWGGADVVAVNG